MPKIARHHLWAQAFDLRLHSRILSFVVALVTIGWSASLWGAATVIDPALTWATFTGTATNTFFDDAQAVATDAAGNIYVAGITLSVNGDDDTFILKLDPNGAVVRRVNIGGEGDDDACDSLYVEVSDVCLGKTKKKTK